jgi:hypothetical protein
LYVFGIDQFVEKLINNNLIKKIMGYFYFDLAHYSSNCQNENSMKKFYVLGLIATFFATQSFGQCTIPNGDFENWTAATDTCIFMTPVNYDYPDDFPPLVSVLLSYFTCLDVGVSETNMSQNGTSAAALWTNNTTSNMADILTPVPFLCNTKPATLDGYVQVNLGAAQDTFRVIVVLHEAGDSVESGYGYYARSLGSPTSGYATLSVPITYDSGKNPDSASIIIMIDADSAAHANSNQTEVLVDNLSFAGAPSSIPAFQSKTRVDVYPNPATDRLYVNVDGKNIIAVTDVTGRIVHIQEVNQSATFDISSLASGVYLLTARRADGEIVNHRFVKQ